MKTRQSKSSASEAAPRRRQPPEALMRRRGRVIANKAYRNAQRWVSRAQGETQEAWEEARAQFLEAWADVGELVQKHPAKVMSAAALAGVAFGSLLFRRD